MSRERAGSREGSRAVARAEAMTGQWQGRGHGQLQGQGQGQEQAQGQGQEQGQGNFSKLSKTFHKIEGGPGPPSMYVTLTPVL